jgi:hypothetical protein
VVGEGGGRWWRGDEKVGLWYIERWWYKMVEGGEVEKWCRGKEVKMRELRIEERRRGVQGGRWEKISEVNVSSEKFEVRSDEN